MPRQQTQKESVSHSLIKEMKQKWLTKHHIEVEAENEKEAINKFNIHSEDYLISLIEFSVSVFIYFVFIIMALIYFFR